MNILFVCHGNICRSVMAEMIMKQMVREAGYILSNSFTNQPNAYYIDSCATSTEEIGNDIYPPAKRCLAEHGISFTHHAARQITKDDYYRFDTIICMEQYNIRNLRRVLGDELVDSDALLPIPKICLLLNRDVADPWYTGDFEVTYRDVVAGCEDIFRKNIMDI